MSTPIIFSGSVPQYYEQYLTTFLFDPYADDLLGRIDFTNVKDVLELAAGTGAVTQKLAAHLPSSAQLTATDLQADMLEIAKQRVAAPNLRWNTVDMTSIAYADDSFDLVVCQFGVMLVPDKLKALQEMHRVLRKGGRLIFNVWGSIAANQVWDIAGRVIASFIGANPILQDPGPFALNNEKDTLQLLRTAGFGDVQLTTVNKTGTTGSAATAAKGFIEGLPVFAAISKKDPSLVPEIVAELTVKFAAQLGDSPLHSSLQALIFETHK